MSGSARPAAITVAVPLPPSYRGGTEEYAYRLAGRLARQAPVRVFTTDVRWQADAPVLDAGAAAVERLPAREVLERPLLLGPRARHRLWTSIRTSRLVHLHMPFPFVEAPAVRIARRAGAASVLTYHMDADLGGVRRTLGANAVTELYRRWSAHPALAACDAIVANSRGYAEASPVLSRHLARVHVIYKGVDPARLLAAAPSARRPGRPPCVPADAAPPGRARLLSIGRLVPYKGIPYLLQAVRHLLDDGRDAVLLVAGRGPLAGELRARAAALRLGDRVRFLGFVPDADIGALYRFADVVVAPSVSTLESNPTALEEAAMCGTPVVGSRFPGADETIPNDGRRGLLVPPCDAPALARAIARLLDAGRPEAPARLRTWDDTAQEYLALFEELGAGLGRGAPSVPIGVPGRLPALAYIRPTDRSWRGFRDRGAPRPARPH